MITGRTNCFELLGGLIHSPESQFRLAAVVYRAVLTLPTYGSRLREQSTYPFNLPSESVLVPGVLDKKFMVILPRVNEIFMRSWLRSTVAKHGAFQVKFTTGS